MPARDDELLARALQHHEDGELPAAEGLYLRLLAASPSHVEARCLLSKLRLQQGAPAAAEAVLREALPEHDGHAGLWSALGDALQLQRRLTEAITAYRRSLDLDDAPVLVWNNLGLALQNCADYPEAQRCYEAALARDPRNPRPLYNLGLLCYQRGDYDGAIGHTQRTLQLAPLNVDAWNNLGSALYAAGRPEDAVAAYQRALRIDPDNAQVIDNLKAAAAAAPVDAEALPEALETDAEYWVNVGQFLQRNKDPEAAKEAYQRALRLDPQQPTALHLLAALSGAQPPAAPTGYVKGLFDDYAERFESHLTGQLGYAVPTQMLALCQRHLGEAMRFDSLLDLGCGTGLVGATFRPHVGRLIGVDLSEEMLRRAARKGAYDELFLASAEEWLSERPDRFALVTTADVLIYLGALDGLFDAVAARLEAGGRWLLSTERLEDSEGDYALRPTGRYAHSRAYLRRLAGERGLLLESIELARIRRDREGWLMGDLVLLQRMG